MDRNTELALIERAQAKLAQRERELAPRDVELSTQRYTDPAWFDGEMTAIFQQAPSIVAHASELPEPGSFLTQQHFGRPLLVTRDSQGEARIFLNVCRHRGAQLETSAKGCKQRFVCGYHAWSYDDKGKLANVPSGFCFPSIETRRRDLVQLAVVEAYGFIWLMPQREAGIAALDAFLGPVREDLAALDLGEFEVYGAQTESWRFNW